jgi:type VI secretion system secreted protein VgrG
MMEMTMLTYVQADRPMAVATPLGKDALLLVGFSGHEAISQLFSFQLDLLAENQTEVRFDKLLGQRIAVSLSLGRGKRRFFQGICRRVTQGHRDSFLTEYYMEIVPQFWLLSRRVQSRIFQHLTVVDILKKVLAGLDVVYEVLGTFYPRDFCVQYQESDFHFACRLMEEEGIYYFFKHTADGHKMVLANTPQSHPDMPEQSQVIFEAAEGGSREEFRIHEWEKAQELRSGKYTLWDHCFELPHRHLEAQQTIQEAVPVGTVNHKLKVAGNDKLEIYQFPGAYAQRFDGVDKGGIPRPAELEKIFKDNERTVTIRMQEEAAAGLVIQGVSNCRQFVSGHKFTLERHFNANGSYRLTGLEHSAKLGGNYRSGGKTTFHYSNRFTCNPLALPYRPPRATPRPRVQGTQTAVVVGPPGEEIFTDKYSRIKVQFHWDREGKNNADSSCWIRVASNWAGKGWGFLQVPRIGQEVIVDFLEGDPDNPIVIGSVFNAEQMPAMNLPGERMVSGLKSSTTPGGGGYNGLIFNDTQNKEMITLHGQKDMTTTIENDDTQTVHNDRTITVDGKYTQTIQKDTTIKITEGKLDHDVAANTAHYHVKGAVTEDFDATQTTKVKNKITIESLEGETLIQAAKKITLHTGDSKITLEANGKISIEGVNIIVTGRTDIKESAPTVEISGARQTVIGVSSQTVTCDTAKVATSGAGISATAVGVHEISGAMVKIN